MADKKIKDFFGKKKMDWKFRKAGEGHSLSEEPKSSLSQPGALSFTGTTDVFGILPFVCRFRNTVINF